jgi:hypothetical protein
MEDPNERLNRRGHPNNIGESGPPRFPEGSGLPSTSSDKVYRMVKSQNALEDIHKSGVVRNKHAANSSSSPRWGKDVFWSRGKDGSPHGLQQDDFLIEAPYNVASKREVRAEDVTAVHAYRNGRVQNILNEEPNENIVRRSRGFLGRGNDSQPKLEYRIGMFLMISLSAFALGVDVITGILDWLTAETAGEVVNFLQIIFFQGIFIFNKAPFWKGSKVDKKVITFIVMTIIGFIPFVNDFTPEIFIDVLAICYFTRQEDREKVATPAKNPLVTRSKR